ncbi:MAG: hemolysin family protein [Gemmatimonadota bacterium]
MLGTVGILILLVFVSGLFSGSEIALFSVSQARARALAEEGRSGAQALLELKGQPERLLITILIGNNVANILAASVATYWATQTFGSAGVGLATGVTTLLVLFFGEITPKSFAAANAVKISLLAAPVLRALSRLFAFLVRPLEALTRAMLPEAADGVPSVTEREIRAMTRMGRQAGAIEEHEHELIERVFMLDTTKAWEVMTPRVEIFAWHDSSTLSEIEPELARVPYSRIPVYAASLDDITGVLYLRDAYQALLSGQGDVRLTALAREPVFVPSSVTLVQLLREFQARRIHMGLVVDEHGGIDGLITLEDILEELVGEIVDEMDVPEEPIVRVGRGEILVDGGADLKEINHFFNTAFPLLEHRSLNGYLLEELGRVPQPHEVLRREGVEIEVLAATETQVTRARLRRIPQIRESGEAEAGGTETVEVRPGTPAGGPEAEEPHRQGRPADRPDPGVSLGPEP